MKSALVLVCVFGLAVANQVPMAYRVNDDAPVAAAPDATAEEAPAASEVEAKSARQGRHHFDGAQYYQARDLNSNVHPVYSPLAYNYYQRPYAVQQAPQQAFRYALPHPYAAAAAYPYAEAAAYPYAAAAAYAQHPFAQQHVGNNQHHLVHPFVQPSSNQYEAASVQNTPVLELKQDFSADMNAISANPETLTPQERFLFGSLGSTVVVSGTTTTTLTSNYGLCKYNFFGSNYICFGR